MNAGPILEVRGLKKSYTSGLLKRRKKEALRFVNLRIERGAVYGILGPNGAGKTTLLSILSTLILPDEGEVVIMGLDALKNGEAVRERVNVSSGNPNFMWSLTVEENLRFYQMLYGMNDLKRIDELVSLFGLEKYRDTRFDELSTGNKQKLALAKSLLNDPEVLLLDEPTVGLDPDASIKVRELIKRIHEEKGMTIVLTTHYMREAEELCERISFLKGGKVLAEGTPEELKAMIKVTRTVEIGYEGSIDGDAVKRLEGVKGLELREDAVRVSLSDPEGRLDELLEAVRKGARVRHIKISEVDLEDVFIEFAKP